MNKFLSMALVVSALPILGAACTTNVVKAGPVTEPTPTDPSMMPADGDDAGADAMPAADPCLCPATCKSTVKGDPDIGKLICHPPPAPKTEPDSSQIGKFIITGFEYWQWVKPDPYDDDKAPAWGYNGDGELGDGTGTSSTTPIGVQGVTTAISVATAGLHGCALDAAGKAYCWGRNDYGQLGIGVSGTFLTPVQVP
jgi:hypothetical protein